MSHKSPDPDNRGATCPLENPTSNMQIRGRKMRHRDEKFPGQREKHHLNGIKSIWITNSFLGLTTARGGGRRLADVHTPATNSISAVHDSCSWWLPMIGLSREIKADAIGSSPGMKSGSGSAPHARQIGDFYFIFITLLPQERWAKMRRVQNWLKVHFFINSFPKA